MRRLFHPLAIATLACTAITAHAASKNIHEAIEPGTGQKILTLDSVHTHNCANDPSPAYAGDINVFFVAQQVGGNQIQYSLTPDLTGHGRVAVNRGDTMDTLTDGTPAQLIAPVRELAEHLHAHRDIAIHETIPFAITREQLVALGNAKAFEFTINGKNAPVHRCIYAKDMKNLTEFLSVASSY